MTLTFAHPGMRKFLADSQTLTERSIPLKRKWLFVTGISLLVMILLICIPPLVTYARTELTASSARITLTADQQRLSHTYTLIGVTGTPDPTQGQVQVRVLTYRPGPLFPLVKAPASSARVAHGILTLTGTSQTEKLPAGTVFTASNGMKVKTEAAVEVPAGQTVTVAATTITPGARGNIGPYGVDTSYTWSYQTYSPLIMHVDNVLELFFCVLTFFLPCLFPVVSTSYDTAQVYNVTAFTGGKDPAVSQDELNQAIAPAVAVLMTQGKQGIQQQIEEGEQLVSTIACTPSISPAHVPANAASVQARVALTCDATVYRPRQVELLAQQMLAEQAHIQLGAQYLLTGDYTTSIEDVTQTGTATTFQVSTQGTWVWTLTNALAQQLARLVAGKTQAAALRLLRHQPGVIHVAIQTSGGMGTALPASPQAITFVVV